MVIVKDIDIFSYCATPSCTYANDTKVTVAYLPNGISYRAAAKLQELLINGLERDHSFRKELVQI